MAIVLHDDGPSTSSHVNASAPHTLTLTIQSLNHPPTASVPERALARENLSGIVLSTLTAKDDDTGESHTFTVKDARIAILGVQLKLPDDVYWNPTQRAIVVDGTPSIRTCRHKVTSKH